MPRRYRWKADLRCSFKFTNLMYKYPPLSVKLYPGLQSEEASVAQVIYNGNNSDGGQVPDDSNNYVSGAPGVNVAVNDNTSAPHPPNHCSTNPRNPHHRQ